MVNPSSRGLKCYLEIWRALNIGQNQGVQIHRSLISVELELQLAGGLPVPGVSLQSIVLPWNITETIKVIPGRPLGHLRPGLGWEVHRVCCIESFLQSSERWRTLSLARTFCPVYLFLISITLQLKFKTILFWFSLWLLKSVFIWFGWCDSPGNVVFNLTITERGERDQRS